MSEYSERKYEALYFGYMEMHRQSREIAFQQMQEMNDEFSKQDEEIERLQAEIKQLRDAVHDVLDSARGGAYGEIICFTEDFVALERLIEETNKEVEDEHE